MRYVQLGNTGLEVSEVGFGGIPIIRLSSDEAVKVLMKAYDGGITFYDTANMYLDSEEKMGKAFAGLRDRLVIATKSLKRNPAGVEEDIELSLRRLQTDYLDLYQIHQFSLESDYEAVMGPGGVLEVLFKAKKAGKIRHIGVTSHSLGMALRLVKTGLFSTVQFPFNFIESDPVKELHPAARESGMAILAMKPFCGGAVDDAQTCFKFLRQFPDVIPLPGFDAVEQVDEVLGFYETGKCRLRGRSRSDGTISQGTRRTVLPALRILPALRARRDDYGCDGIPGGRAQNVPRQGIEVPGQGHGIREELHRVRRVRGGGVRTACPSPRC